MYPQGLVETNRDAGWKNDELKIIWTSLVPAASAYCRVHPLVYLHSLFQNPISGFTWIIYGAKKNMNKLFVAYYFFFLINFVSIGG